MKIFTSYYANINKIRDKYPDYKFISISIYPPKGITVDYHEPLLAPSNDILFSYKDNPNEELYVKDFNELHQIEDYKNALINISNNVGKGQNIVLLCYEIPTDFCHRHIVSSKLKEYFKTEVKELFHEGDYTKYKLTNNLFY